MSSADALPIFDYAYWSAQDMTWLPDPFELDQSLSPFPHPYAASWVNAGPGHGENVGPQWPGQWSAHTEPFISQSFHVPAVVSLGTRDYGPDLDLVSSDGVHFSVNAAKLRENSLSNFGGFLTSSQSTANVTLSSNVLNLLLHAIHGMSVTGYKHSFMDIGRMRYRCRSITNMLFLAVAVNALERYGLSKAALAAHPGSPLYEVILFQAQSLPIKCYSLAAHAGLDKLAVAISPYTLSISLPDITDEDAGYMGAIYLKRLLFLHLGRVEALGRILRVPLATHLPTQDCRGRPSQLLREAWLKKVAEILWVAGPNISAISLETRLSEVKKETDCFECAQHLDYGIKKLLAEWSLIKNTI